MALTDWQGVSGNRERQMLNATIQGACAYHTGAKNPFNAKTDPELYNEFNRARDEQWDIVNGSESTGSNH